MLGDKSGDFLELLTKLGLLADQFLLLLFDVCELLLEVDKVAFGLLMGVLKVLFLC